MTSNHSYGHKIIYITAPRDSGLFESGDDKGQGILVNENQLADLVSVSSLVTFPPVCFFFLM